jgi:hypothetical protein
LRPDFDAALPDAFLEDFDAEVFDEDEREVFDADFLPEAFAEDLRDAPLRVGAFALAAREAVEAAFSIAVFAPEGPSSAGPGRIMSPAAGLTAPTASAAVSKAADASPAACSPACPINLEAASTAPPRTPRATSSAPPPLFFFAIFNSFGELLAVGCRPYKLPLALASGQRDSLLFGFSRKAGSAKASPFSMTHIH